MIVKAVIGSDALSGQIKDYCSGLPDVEKVIADADSADGKKIKDDFKVSSVPMVIVLDEDSKVLFQTADMKELEKFFA
ncbi:hypothetical protein DWQ65_05870 [Treponema phagedenis]|uniref:Thioredoxin family protein n=1 Tax=Treponema phagedenis TaxID=162 RepID=A0A0B7GQA7_TREPH|nr:hypothetical protein [Treponema phagedenis]EFW38512.1 hypothetical protein HMPREF9554_00964 [Treponema phagedenis F0421]NVP24586.1 hypothetical protein [Treponema phagedenis]QEJ94717.1 hypothetical protein FUT79_05525 [Treponema phagedenis]QEJ97654.1 hypothetical protein FUT82_06380 [Treponema phagedenis]QEK00622.1 hypothetical protein FUT84_05215 [Treponema phagedenis]